MTQEGQNSSALIKLLSSAALAGFIAIMALVWSIYSARSEDHAMRQQLANQATQIANQDIQISLAAQQNGLLSQQGTLEAERSVIEEQLRTPVPANNTELLVTATSLAMQSNQIEATRQAIEAQQQQIEVTQSIITPADSLNCQFIGDLVAQGDVIQWIDTPLGSLQWSGIQIRLTHSILVPAGWVVHYGSPIDQHGPLELPAGAIASIYSPYSCRPLEKVP